MKNTFNTHDAASASRVAGAIVEHRPFRTMSDDPLSKEWLGRVNNVDRTSQDVTLRGPDVLGRLDANSDVFVRREPRRHVSALRYRQMVELSPEAILVCRDGVLLLANQAATRLLGGGQGHALTGRRINNFICRDFRAIFAEYASNAGAAGFHEQTWMRLDGSRLDVEIGISILPYNNALQVVVRDISARKRAEAIQLGQNRILNLVATGAPLAATLSEIACFVEQHSDRGMCSILLLDSDGFTLSERIAPSLPPSYLAGMDIGRVGPSNCSCGTAVFRREPVMVTDISSDPLWERRRDLALRHGLRACTSWPIFGASRNVLGTFRPLLPGCRGADRQRPRVVQRLHQAGRDCN